MERKILEYKKTDHFLYRQWDRKISDLLLYKALPFVSSQSEEELIIVIKSERLKLNQLHQHWNQFLAIVVKRKILITCFWCDELQKIRRKNRKILIIK